MRKRELWMKRFARVKVFGKEGDITHMERSFIGYVEYVHYIYVKLDGEDFKRVYHPNDVEQP